MIPGLGGINPKKMQGMMKQMGIKQDEIEAERVVIEKSDGRIIIENPKLLQRPIVVANTKAVIAQPPEKIDLVVN